MRPDLTRHVVLICCTILVAVKPCFSEERRKYNDFFHQLEEIKAAWRRYQELMHYPNCTVTTTTTDVTGNIRSVLVDHYKSRLDCTLVHNVVVQNNLDLQSDVERVSCYNPKYYFTLIKRNQTGDYAIKHIAFSEEDARPILEPIRQEDYYVRNVLLMLNRHAMLAQIVEQSFFKVNNVDFFEHNGERLLRLRFDSSHDIIAMAREKKQRPLFVQAGTVVLDPNRFWTIREAHIEARYLNVSTREECEVTVTADGGGVPLPQCRKIRQTFFLRRQSRASNFLVRGKV